MQIPGNRRCLYLSFVLVSVWSGVLDAEPNDVVINEILYHPDPGNTGGEFVELFNRGDTAVDVSGWSFDDAVSFELPAGTVVEAGTCFGAGALFLYYALVKVSKASSFKQSNSSSNSEAHDIQVKSKPPCLPPPLRLPSCLRPQQSA